MLNVPIQGWVAFAVLGQAVQGRWAMTQLPAEERARDCQEQVSFCYNTCGSVARTTVNFCNIRTMGWNCECSSKAAERSVHGYEWPISVSECRAALSTCNQNCAARANANERPACFTSCTVDYPCNTGAAPSSKLRVLGVNDKPAGYIPPLEDKDIELAIGMKFDLGSGDGGQQAQRTGDVGSLPKIVPKDDSDMQGSGGSRKSGGSRPGAGGDGQRDVAAASAAGSDRASAWRVLASGALLAASAALY
ncbi:hypothetical protein GGF46_000905 [Coemansia sp. RSA 552]|nr:hypothetical protein GGF46_000905 [Coemansia sp. RSA 552]